MAADFDAGSASGVETVARNNGGGVEPKMLFAVLNLSNAALALADVSPFCCKCKALVVRLYWLVRCRAETRATGRPKTRQAHAQPCKSVKVLIQSPQFSMRMMTSFADTPAEICHARVEPLPSDSDGALLDAVVWLLTSSGTSTLLCGAYLHSGSARLFASASNSGSGK